MKKLSYILIAMLSFSLSACETFKDVSEEDVEKAAAFATCVKGCYDATQADPELLQP